MTTTERGYGNPYRRRQSLIYRRMDLAAAIAREKALARNTALLHAAVRAVKALDEFILEDTVT